MGTNDLMLTLAACRIRDGFSSEEVARAHEIFGGLVNMPQVSSTGWGHLAKASGLAKGLLKFLGLYSMSYISSLEGALPSDSTEPQGVCFYEFLVWARQLRDIMMQDLWESFQEFGAGVSGAVQLDVAVSIVQRFGISLLAGEVDDLLSDLGLPREAPLDFHALVRFLGAAHRTHGFSHAEFEELRAAFQKFDYNRSGELEHLEVLALLRYNGYTTNLEQENVLMRRVDFNNNGSMDLDEFLMLMRLTREQVIGVARKSFDELSNCTGWLPQGKVKAALAKVHLVPRLAMIAELLHEMPADVSFSQFMQVHDQCRIRVNHEFRKYGGFSDDALSEITRLWNCGGVSKKKFATVSELIWMFADSNVAPVTTRDGREELLRRVEAARSAALAAGVPQEEVTHAGTTDIGFNTFLHLIRGMVSTLEQDVVTRENAAMSVANIPPREASEFRSAFVDFAAKEAVWYRPVAMADRLLSRLTAVPAISESSMPHLMKFIGLRLPSSKLGDLKIFLAQTRSQSEEDDQSIQFATFLRMLGWMFETDFAGISASTACPTKAIGA
jgi:Ca2+-binding EF-hand superfamily protein